MAQMTLAANVGQGTATFSVTGSRRDGDSRHYTDYTTYEFVATPANGWRFVGWETRQRTSYSSSSSAGQWTDWSSWSSFSSSLTAAREFITRTVSDYSGSTWGTIYVTGYEHEVRAVFEVDEYTVAVDVSSESPANSGSVSGGGTFASGASCTVSATANNGFEFVKWTQTGGSGAPAVSTDASYTFTVTASVHLYAHFRRESTGLLLHGSSNTLLHGSSGTLLHDS